jgi:hypothetical protein
MASKSGQGIFRDIYIYPPMKPLPSVCKFIIAMLFIPQYRLVKEIPLR